MILEILRSLSHRSAELFVKPMKGKYLPRVDLSVQNVHKTGANIFQFEHLEAFVEARKAATGSDLVWGGYLEQRLIYLSSPLFHSGFVRNIHLGLDFWTAAGAEVFVPLAGEVHSFQDNAGFKDYGPTVIVKHDTPELTFYSLYGHLSRTSLEGLKVGTEVAIGQRIGWIGPPSENGHWPAHLHFQLMLDLQQHHGDYPGVCAVEELGSFVPNCPDPRFLLGI